MTAPTPNAPDAELRAQAPRFTGALRWWLKLGCISFGGPAGQIALMHDELVERRRWIDEAHFLHALNFCLLLPGPEAQQLATYIGWRLHGLRGGIAAGLLFVLPSLLLLLALSWAYVAFRHVPAIESALFGLRAAVVAIIANAAWRLGRRLLKSPAQIGIALAALLALASGQVPFPWLIAAAALAGALLLRGLPSPADNQVEAASSRPSPFRWRTLARVVLTCVLLWLGVWAILPDGVLRTMALFFSKAAFLTFGGAYAVLPYVNAAAVQKYGWLAQGQMVDGLALGETTPGPLIMVVAFVGFVGGWQTAAGGVPLAHALAGGLVATFFTFLPSFLLVLAGAPMIDALRARRGLSAPLGGVNAAVIGVIVHLAWVFAQSSFVHGPRVDVFSVVLAVAAWLALRRPGVGVVPVMLACALAGMARGALGGDWGWPG